MEEWKGAEGTILPFVPSSHPSISALCVSPVFTNYANWSIPTPTYVLRSRADFQKHLPTNHTILGVWTGHFQDFSGFVQ